VKITVYLNEKMTRALMQACGRERRYPRQQAEHLLEQALFGPASRALEDADDPSPATAVRRTEVAHAAQ
jgi:hypothetical protein